MYIEVMVDGQGTIEKREFNYDSDINILLDNIAYVLAFRITNSEWFEHWNKIIGNGWSNLCEIYYWRYNKPYIKNSEWHTCEDGYILTVSEYIMHKEECARYFKELQSKYM